MAQGPGEVEEGSDRTADTSTAATAAAPTTDDIRSQIEQTRAEMSATIDAIQTRLSPARALADAKDAVTDAAVGRLKGLAHRTRASGGSVLETVRDNPLPFAFLAAAAVGLIGRALNHGKWRRRPRAARTLDDHGEQDWRDRSNRVTLRRSNKRFLAAASAGAACWAIWRAQTAAPHRGNADPETPGARDEGGDVGSAVTELSLPSGTPRPSRRP